MNNDKLYLILPLVALMTACQPEHAIDQAALEQKFICTSLIDGFLKVTHNSHYRFTKSIESPDQQKIYLYTVSSDHAVKLNSPTQKNLNFQCDDSKKQTYQVFLLDQTSKTKQPILSFHLPQTAELKQFTAYTLKND